MKRLKKACRFNGKQYPLYLLIASVFAAGFGIIGYPSALSVLLLLSPVIVLVVSYAVEQHLTPGERKIIADTPYPLWQPVTAEVKTRIIEEQSGTQMTLPQMLTACALCAGFVFLMGVMPGRHSRKSLASPQVMLVISLLCAAVLFIYLIVTKGIGANWMEIDDSAVFVQIPIHHMFDITRHGRHGRTWVDSYLVFYQPDGRYVLRAPKDSGFCNTVTVVKYRGAVTWFVSDEQNPEDFLP